MIYVHVNVYIYKHYILTINKIRFYRIVRHKIGDNE